jgi:3-phosphoshikimate 1-carboxyvinyltransferase
MSFAVLGTVAEGETIINDPDCISKSYPGFWVDLASLGAETRRTD